jgi:hypothetical protein
LVNVEIGSSFSRGNSKFIMEMEVRAVGHVDGPTPVRQNQ